jgi:glutathione synthase/RimK-type ligase-like ATP-grasp enzyme
VRYRAPAEYAWNHPGRYGPMIVQQFIDTGEHITVCRVLTLFGEPLYAMADRTEERRVSLTASDAEIEAAPIASQLANENEAYLVYEKRILDLARSAHAAIPEVPLKGCDVIQDVNTGKLYLLEVNCGGNTWHFSSEQQAEEREYTGRDFAMRRYLQFDGLRTAARVLVARTNAEAE